MLVAPLTPLSVTKMEFAQTHVLPEAGLSWTLPNDSETLHLVGGRDALALVAVGQADVQAPVFEAWSNGVRVGTVALNPPSSLPATEANGTLYATDRWSAVVPGAWLTPGASFKVSSSNYATSAEHYPNIGLDADELLHILPFYLFGANDANSIPYATTQAPSAAEQNELFAKWPVAKLHVDTVGRVNWTSLVVRPRNDSNGVAQPAYVMTAWDQQKDSFAGVTAVADVVQAYRNANGEAATNNEYYDLVVPLDSTGKYVLPGGGIGGGGVGTGGSIFMTLMFHELGHGYGLGHSPVGYTDGTFPYPGGSLDGSVWGYDPSHGQFLNVVIPPTASLYSTCASFSQLDPYGRCYKEDPMDPAHNAAGDQAPGYTYSMFSDFHVGKVQRWFEGTTTTDTAGNHIYSGGRILVDSNSPTGYSKWDTILLSRQPVSAISTTNKGLYGQINQGLPIATALPVYSIAITMSLPGTPGATQIFPPLARTGNLVRLIDPTNAQDLAAITPSSGQYSAYCEASGCDYTLRVTFADGSQIYRVLEGGFRGWYQPTAAPPANALDPTNAASYQTWAINVPSAKAISTIELLDTPMVWNGIAANPTVLASR